MLRQLRQFAPHLGWAGALALYGRTKFGHDAFGVALPGYRQPILIRPRTSDRNMFVNVFLDREYDFPLPSAPGVIVDGGANVGYTSVFFAQRFPQARIFAIEPEDSNFALLETNTRPYPNVRRIKAGLWSRTTNLVIENPGDVKSGFRLTESDAPVPGSLPALTLSDLMAREGLQHIDILKIDVEGAERELFSDPGRRHWLSRTRQLVIELHDRFKPGCSAAVDAAIAEFPHRRFAQGDNLIVDFQTH